LERYQPTRLNRPEAIWPKADEGKYQCAPGAASDGATAHRPPPRPWDRRRTWSRSAHGFTALPLAPSTTSPYLPLQVEANPFSSSSCSPLLALLCRPRAHFAWHRQPPATAEERCLKHHHPRAPSDSSDRAFVHPRATSPRPEDC
jgi:hypothetical protein